METLYQICRVKDRPGPREQEMAMQNAALLYGEGGNVEDVLELHVALPKDQNGPVTSLQISFCKEASVLTQAAAFRTLHSRTLLDLHQRGQIK